ncbi:unnamed protein product [Euphydryas editha]|uniref:Uncharacterized protein n=1 Tax=Euphydryas editha TaxID=104508 RepID=A0AAU9TUM2_EUPED|nr:unnamed protein product [Euphydryas editha]
MFIRDREQSNNPNRAETSPKRPTIGQIPSHHIGRLLELNPPHCFIANWEITVLAKSNDLYEVYNHVGPTLLVLPKMVKWMMVPT